MLNGCSKAEPIPAAKPYPAPCDSELFEQCNLSKDYGVPLVEGYRALSPADPKRLFGLNTAGANAGNGARD
jgi:hypothetical protein